MIYVYDKWIFTFKLFVECHMKGTEWSKTTKSGSICSI